MASRSAGVLRAARPAVETRFLASRALAAAVPVLLALVLWAGCAQEPEDAVVSMKGWGMSLDELRSEYERLNGPGGFDTTSVATREEFARTLADKEILLRQARESEKELEGRFGRRFRVVYEKNLARDYLAHRRQIYSLSEEQIEENLPLVSRVAFIRACRLQDGSLSPQVYEEMQQGVDFETLAAKYGTHLGDLSPRPEDQGVYWQKMQIQVGAPRTRPGFIAQALLRDLPEGSVAGPVETPDGIFILDIMRYEPIEEAGSDAFRRRAVESMEAIGYMGVYQAWADSLREAYEVKYYPENYPVIRDRFAAFWDSINAAVAQKLPIDYAGMEPPMDSFTREELQLPLYDMGGKTHTVGDFVEGLRHVDLDYWPTLGPDEKIFYQIEARLGRLLFQTEAEKTGFTELPEFAGKTKRLHEEARLDQLFDGLGETNKATDEEIEAFYNAHPNGWVASEMLSFSALTYPESMKSRAERVLKRLREGDPLLWLELAPAEGAAEEQIEYLPPTEPMDAARPAPIQEWAPLLQAARGLEEGAVSDLVPSGREKYSLVRLQERQPRRALPLVECRDMVARRVQQEKNEKLIDEILERERKSQNVKVYPERLAPQAG